MYFQKIFNVVLQEKHIEPIIIEEKTNNKEQSEQINNQTSERINENLSNHLSRAYGLFSTDGQSFLAMHENKKITVFLNEINHPDKYDKTSKDANNFINEKIKKKTIFLNIIKVLEDGNIIADVFLSDKKEESLNSMLKDLNLDKTLDIKDEKEIKSMGITAPSTNEQSKQPIQQKNNNSDSLIGYLINYGHAPYLNKPGNKDSFFITLENENNTITKWGIDFERAIQEASVKKNDFVKIIKTGVTEVNNKKLNFWEITILEDAHTIASKIDGPPRDENDFPHDDYGYQEPLIVYDDDSNLDPQSYKDLSPPSYHNDHYPDMLESNHTTQQSSDTPDDDWTPDWDVTDNQPNLEKETSENTQKSQKKFGM